MLHGAVPEQGWARSLPWKGNERPFFWTPFAVHFSFSSIFCNHPLGVLVFHLIYSVCLALKMSCYILKCHVIDEAFANRKVKWEKKEKFFKWTDFLFSSRLLKWPWTPFNWAKKKKKKMNAFIFFRSWTWTCPTLCRNDITLLENSPVSFFWYKSSALCNLKTKNSIIYGGSTPLGPYISSDTDSGDYIQ